MAGGNPNNLVREARPSPTRAVPGECQPLGAVTPIRVSQWKGSPEYFWTEGGLLPMGLIVGCRKGHLRILRDNIQWDVKGNGYNGMLRGRIKSEKREGSWWFGEEKAWKKTKKKG